MIKDLHKSEISYSNGTRVTEDNFVTLSYFNVFISLRNDKQFSRKPSVFVMSIP